MIQSEFALDVRTGLSDPGQKQLPPKYFYDELGVALYEAITLLPEYGLTRADTRLLQRHAPDIAQLCQGTGRLAELGSGTGAKTRPILAAFSAPPAYFAIDLADAALERCRQELDGFDVHTIHAAYIEGLRLALDGRQTGSRALVLFLGSTIGNFDRDSIPEFLREVRSCLCPGDLLLLGADLEKDPDVIIPAYDDPTGVTAAFNLNVLGRINRQLGANFDLRAFAHEARYDRLYRRIEMHLRSLREQTVEIPGARVTVHFAKDETIWTESSHKFGAGELASLGACGGFRSVAQWIDNGWPFAETLYVAE